MSRDDASEEVNVTEKLDSATSDTNDVKNGKRDTEKKKNIPPFLKIDEVTVPGEKSPAPTNVYDLFKKYQKPNEKRKAEGDNMNVEFDQLSSDEKNGFLRKLQMLTIGNKKSTTKHEGESSQQSPAGRILKKIVPSRRSSVSKAPTTEQPSRFSMFSRTDKKISESERQVDLQQQNRKQSARRLNFQAKDTDRKPHSEVQKNKVVAAMTREYEKIVNLKAVPMPINKTPRLQAPRGSLETPTVSPINNESATPISSPEKASEVSGSPVSDRYTPDIVDESQAKNKKRGSSRFGGQSSCKSVSNASWHGELPPRDYTSPTFSRKIFVGGVPWDITEAALKDSFGEFGTCAVEWPGQEARYRSGQTNLTSSNASLRNQSKFAGQAATGYVYMIFEDERAVAALLHECSQEIGGAGEWYFKIRAQRSKSTEIRQVQIIPWVTSDSLFCEDESILETGIEPKRTVFVGALHGMMTAQVLHWIMEDCFGCVECVQLDTDKFKYPIGSGRVTFREHGAYFKAIEIGYLHVLTSKFRKRVQIDPFLESTCCMVCSVEPAHCFCRNRNCFKYYCHNCWAMDHSKDNDADVHVPVIVPSSASKAYSGPSSRRSHLTSHSPSKPTSHSSSNHAGYAQMLSPAFPMIVGGPPQTLSALYGFMQNQQQQCLLSPPIYESGPITPSPSETNSKRGSRTDFQTNTALYMNQTPIMSPQKGHPCTDNHLSAYYSGSTAFLTPPPTYYNSPSQASVSTAQQFYSGGNYYYGYMAQPVNTGGQFVYDMNLNPSPRSSIICAPTSAQSYQ